MLSQLPEEEAKAQPFPGSSSDGAETGQRSCATIVPWATSMEPAIPTQTQEL